MAADQHQLFLVRAKKSRGGGHWSDDDYDVRQGRGQGPVIGRIFRAPQSPEAQPWFWTLTRFPSSTADRGYAETREAAMAALKAAWTRGTAKQ